jgi:sarcosine oxidase subunit delta
MRIACPYCGERDRQEFTVLGDAAPVRPDGLEVDRKAMFDYLYLRDNRAGPHREFWHHGAGCHAWLIVTRDTLTHAVLKVEPAREVALARRRTGAGR